MYKHYDIDDKYISLHDCHATNISYDNGVLTFTFDDGIWVVKGHPDNTVDKTVRTDTAAVRFYLESGEEYDVVVHVFEEMRGNTIRKEWNSKKLIKNINSKKYTLEFLYDYKGYNSVIMDCELWSDKKPYSRECQLKLSIKATEYCWNELREDREW